MKRTLITMILIGFAATLAFASGSREDRTMRAEPTTQAETMTQMEEQTAPAPTIVDIAAGNERFSTLVTALSEAGLVETLNGEGPFTVFAPTNEAFAALPAGALESLLADKEALTQVLLYHVTPGTYMASDVVKLDSADTAAGMPVKISAGNDGVMINESRVVITDIQASNGVIHVIDRVLLPQTTM